MITGGSLGSLELSEVKRPRLEDEGEDAIIFIKRDAEGVLAPYNDAVVVTTNIIDFNVHHIYSLIMEARSIFYTFLFLPR